MSEANEFVEQMEHAAHGGHAGHDGHAPPPGSRDLGRYVGITMACLGVLLALCSALVGGQRTELVTTMVEQTNVALRAQAISTKHRTMLAQLQQLHSLYPDPERFNRWEAEASMLEKAAAGTQAGQIMRVIRLENAKNLNAEIPTHKDMLQFVTSIRSLDKERQAAHAWADSYEATIKAHAHAAEHYEWAQLGSEIGIVMASIALLLLNRRVWYIAILLGVASLVIVAETHFASSHSLHKAEAKIEESRATYFENNTNKKGHETDEELLRAVEGAGATLVVGD